MTLSGTLKDAARALSLANLCFVAVWSELVGQSADWRQEFGVYSPNNYIAAMVSVMLLGGVFFGALSLARAYNPVGLRLARGAFLIVLIIPLCGVAKAQFPHLRMAAVYQFLKLGYFNQTELVIIANLLVFSGAVLLSPKTRVLTGVGAAVVLSLLGTSEIAVMWLVVVILVILAAVRWHQAIATFASTLVLVLTPFVAITFVQALGTLTRLEDKPRPLPLAGSSAQRVVWVVFDEMDQRVTFSHRPSGLELDELDKLRSEAIHASNAYPPADFTLLSMPALLTGRLITRAEPYGPSELILTLADSGETVRWSEQPNIFTSARQVGVDTSVVGWYQPYCRILGSSITECSSQDIGRRTLAAGILRHFESVAYSVPAAEQLGLPDRKDIELARKRRRHQEDYLRILEQAKRVTIDRRLGLVLVQFPVPHSPGIYSRAKRDFELEAESSYLDNLALADRALGELRRHMESAGVWDDAIVLVTSDHWWRADIWRGMKRSEQHRWTAEDESVFTAEIDQRVPYLLKLPRQITGLSYELPFNTVLTPDLLLALLAGELRTQGEVIEWLRSHGSTEKGPYRFDDSAPAHGTR
jgi:hypothetical protein